MACTEAIKKIFITYAKGKLPFLPPATHVKWGITFDKHKIYENYKHNISEIIRIAKDNRFPIIISTVAYNRMVPPFKAADNNAYNLCGVLYRNGDFKAAKACFDDVLDADLQPHRANKTTNNIVKELSKEYGISLADVDMKIVSIAKNGIPGNDLFEDHCHFNLFGNEILQEVLFEVIKNNQLLKKGIRSRGEG